MLAITSIGCQKAYSRASVGKSMRDLMRATLTPSWRFLARLALMRAIYGKTPPSRFPTNN
jgi:hypothetical protein